MPLYDYVREDGTVFEACRPADDCEVAWDHNGVKGRLVWLKPPSVSIPVWHQSAPKESPKEIELLRRAEDKNDPVRVWERGTSRDISRAREYKKQKEKEQRIKSIEKALTSLPDVG